MVSRAPRSFRFDAQLIERLERKAAELGVTQTELVERYVDEGLRQDMHPGVVFVDGAAGRRARVAGTGLEVWEVVSTVQAEGAIAPAAEYLSIPERFVVVAMRYYADYPHEVDAWIAETDRLYDEEIGRQRRVADALG